MERVESINPVLVHELEDALKSFLGKIGIMAGKVARFEMEFGDTVKIIVDVDKGRYIIEVETFRKRNNATISFTPR